MINFLIYDTYYIIIKNPEVLFKRLKGGWILFGSKRQFIVLQWHFLFSFFCHETTQSTLHLFVFPEEKLCFLKWIALSGKPTAVSKSKNGKLFTLARSARRLFFFGLLKQQQRVMFSWLLKAFLFIDVGIIECLLLWQ